MGMGGAQVGARYFEMSGSKSCVVAWMDSGRSLAGDLALL